MSAFHLTTENFLTTVSSNSVTVIDFWADWCGPCKMLGPTIDTLAEEYEGKALIAKLNVDQAPNLAQQFGVMTIPTIIILKDGKEVDRKVGVQAKSVFQAAINAHL